MLAYPKIALGLMAGTVCVTALALATGLPRADIFGLQQDPPQNATPLVTRDAVEPQALGAVTVLHLGAIHFQPISSVQFAYVSPGGVQVSSGSAYFNAGIPVPAGSRLLTVDVFLNPNGVIRSMGVTRYRPSAPPEYKNLVFGSSSAGTQVEQVRLNVGKSVSAGWNYRVSSLLLEQGGAIVYGMRIRYRPPI